MNLAVPQKLSSFLLLFICLFSTAPVRADDITAPSKSSHKPGQTHITIPTGSLDNALISLATQLRISLFYSKESVENHEVKGFSTDSTFTLVLERLLKDRCLKYEFVRESFVAITQGCDEPSDGPKVTALQPTEAPPSLIENLTVQGRQITGTRIRQTSHRLRMPLDVIDQTEIRLSGFQDVGELLRYVPAVSGNSTSTLISNGGDGRATVTLRGLPANNTLVLLNGRRLNADALKGQAVDLNTLPLGMIEQIEILKDGVSAIYGSDAIAGVVNIITRDSTEGFAIDLYQGQADEGGRDTRNVHLSFGHNTNKWGINLGASYYDQKGILSRNRSLSASSDDRSRGGIDKRSSATVPARINLASGAVILAQGATGTQPSDFQAATLEDRFEFRDFTSSIVPSERISVFFHSDYLTDYWQFYADGLYTSTEATSLLAPTPLFTGFENIPLTVSGNNIYNPFAVDIVDVRRRVVELNARKQINKTRTNRLVVGALSQRGAWQLDFALQLSRTHAEEQLRNGMRLDHLEQALSDNCLSPCVPLNVFGPAGSITQEMLNYLSAHGQIRGDSGLYAVTIDAAWTQPQAESEQLATRPISVSTGVEFRQELLDTKPNFILANQLYAAGGNRSSVDNVKRDVIEWYGESVIPFDLPFSVGREFDLQLALRFSHYADFGSQVNPRAAFTWRLNEQWQIRGSNARGFRAPSLLQLHGSELQSFEQLNDPCSEAQNVPTLPGCSVLADPTLTQYLTISSGNKNLKAERSRTTTIGIDWENAWTLKSAPADLIARFSLDAYWIDQKDVVDASAQFILNQNATNLLFPSLVTRDLAGNLTEVVARLQNIGERQVAGFDLTASVSFPIGQQHLKASLNATHISEFKDKFDPLTPSVDKAGTFSDEASGGLGSLPEWKWNLGVAWQGKYWQVYYNLYHVSNLTEVVPLRMTRRQIHSWTTQNLNLTLQGPYTSWYQFTFGVNNLANRQPPFSAAAFNDSYDGRTYDITGRYFFLKISKDF